MVSIGCKNNHSRTYVCKQVEKSVHEQVDICKVRFDSNKYFDGRKLKNNHF